MDQLTLTAQKRTEKPQKVRDEGFIPAVVYGHNVESVSIQVPYSAFQKFYREAGESTIFTLKVEKETYNVLVKDVQLHDVSDDFDHIDFYVVRMDEEITTEVELVFIGESEAVKSEDGILVKNIDAVEVTCLPAHLPSEIEVDIASLKTFDDVIAVKDLKVPSEVKIENEAEDIVATVTPPRSEEELEALDEEITEDIEGVEGVTKETDADGKESEAETKEDSPEESK